MKKLFKSAALLALALMMLLTAACSATGDDAGGDTTTPPTEGNNQTGDGDNVTSPETDTEGNGEASGEQVFIWVSGSELTGLNPTMNTTSPDNTLQDMIYETLVAYVAGPNGEAVAKPAAAESWKISEDGKTYTFHIRKNAKWNDGVAVTADDFVFTYQLMADPATGSANAWLFDGIIENFAESYYDDGKKPEDIGVRKIDEHTVEFTLTQPASFFLELIASAKPVRQDKYEEYGASYGSDQNTVVTNGPFQIESWNPNVQMTLVKNPNYWGVNDVKLERIERKVITEVGTSVQALLNGDIDTVSTTDPDWQQLIKESGDYYEIMTPTRAPEFLAFNCSNEYFKHPKIRQAFALAIDQERFVNDLRDGLALPITTLMPEVINVGDSTYQDRVNGRNLDILKDLHAQYPDPKALLIEGLTEAGFDPDPSKMTIRYASRGTSEVSKKFAEWYYQEFTDILGVNIEIEMMEWNIMWERIDAGDYDIATSGWGPYYNDPIALLGLFDMDRGYFNSKKSGWDDADAVKFAEILRGTAEMTDDQEKAEAYLEAEQLLVGTAVIVPIYLPMGYTYMANYIQGYYTNPNTYTDHTVIYNTGK